MEVIKDGKPREYSCHWCQSLLAVTVDDIRLVVDRDYTGDINSEWHEFTCPQCQATTKLKITDIPYGWDRILRGRK